MNKVILIGRLARDPEMRSTMSGSSVTRFTIAVTRTYQDQNGERGADFINCVAWRKQAENIAKYCVTGTQVAVEGRIQTGSYDAQDGSKRYTTDIICDNVTFLGTKGDSLNKENNYSSNTNDHYSTSDIPTSDISEDPYKDFGEEIALTDDDLPF